MDPPSSGTDPETPLPPLQTLLERARDLAEGSRAPSTRRAYRADLAGFGEFCRRNGVASHPASSETVAAFLAHLAQEGRKSSTIARAVTAITTHHLASGFPSPRADPLVRDTLRGIRRRLGTAPTRKAPLVLEDLGTVLGQLPDSIAGTRDRAILLVGFWGALRRSELVAIDVEDVEFTEQGVLVRIRRAKNDGAGRGRKVALPKADDPSLCPSVAIGIWKERAGIAAGPLFRSLGKGERVLARRLHAGSVAAIVKTHVTSIGRHGHEFGGHSLRRGFATSAARAGLSDGEIARQTGHADLAQLRAYVIVDDGLAFAPFRRFGR
jgi:integrase